MEPATAPGGPLPQDEVAAGTGEAMQGWRTGVGVAPTAQDGRQSLTSVIGAGAAPRERKHAKAGSLSPWGQWQRKAGGGHGPWFGLPKSWLEGVHLTPGAPRLAGRWVRPPGQPPGGDRSRLASPGRLDS